MAGRLGMWLLLASLGMLFAASLLAAVIIRTQIDGWPDDLPGLPGLLWLSTPLLLVSSATIQLAVRAARSAAEPMLARMLLATTVLGIGFLVLQAVCWMQWLDAIEQRWVDDASQRFAVAGFYVLTGLHAAHVVGGLVPLGFLSLLAGRRRLHLGRLGLVEQTAMYWHFLDVVWIVLFAILLFVL